MTDRPEGLDWQSLVVTVNDRAAIYAERFPAMLDNALASADDPDAARAETLRPTTGGDVLR